MNAWPTTDAIVQVGALATEDSLTIWNFAGDSLIIIVPVLIFVAFARSEGRGPFVAVLLSFYCAYALYLTFPYASFLPTAPALTALLAQVGLYFALTLVFYLILRRVVVSDFLFIGL